MTDNPVEPGEGLRKMCVLVTFVAVRHSPAKAGEAAGEPMDVRGWDEYGHDWRNYYECMLAPVAQQAAGARAPDVAFSRIRSQQRAS